MKRILLSLAIISIVAAGAIGATRAYFSDSGTISGNTFTSGIMDLRIDRDPDPDGVWWVDSFVNPYNFFANVKPGDHGQQILDIKNIGSVDGNTTIKFDVTSWSALVDNLNFVVTYDPDNDGTFEIPVASGLLNVWNGNTYPLGSLGANKIGSVRIDWSVPTTAGNDIQGKSVTLNTTFGLNQAVPTRVTGSELPYGSGGWGGLSCPAGKTAVSGGVLGATQAIAAQGLAVSGANIGGVAHPIFPHYTFPTGETGYVVHNGNVGQNLTIYVDCL